jgi:hypothetical protein
MAEGIDANQFRHRPSGLMPVFTQDNLLSSSNADREQACLAL